MSSIGSLGAQSLAAFIQNIQGSNSTQAATAASGTTDSSSTQSVQGGHHHHHGGGGAGFKALQDAVTSALQQAQSSGSTDDPDSTIENAIASIFKNASNSGASTTGQTSALQTAGTPNSAVSDASSAETGATGNSPQSTFLQTLQQFGVSPEQFQSDFLSAIQNAQNGQVNPGTAFQSFPTGTLLDLTA